MLIFISTTWPHFCTLKLQYVSRVQHHLNIIDIYQHTTFVCSNRKLYYYRFFFDYVIATNKCFGDEVFCTNICLVLVASLFPIGMATCIVTRTACCVGRPPVICVALYDLLVCSHVVFLDNMSFQQDRTLCPQCQSLDRLYIEVGANTQKFSSTGYSKE